MVSTAGFIAQGRKRALLGEEVFRYDPGHYLLFTVDLPLIFQIEKATQDEPYLGLRLDLDPSLVASVLVEADIKINKGDASTKAMDVHTSDANLLDAVVRLVRLADEPGSSNVLAPLVVKEIIYRLLAGGPGRAARSSLTVRRHATHLAGDRAPPHASR